MPGNNQIREYRTDDLIVYWNRAECSHAGKCVALMPKVFSPDSRPWVCLDGADPLEVIRTIDQCPTGALRYALTENSKIDPELAKGPGWIGYKPAPPTVQIRVLKSGPLLVKGSVRLVDHSGNLIRETDSVVLCRCGKSKNQPFCDGAHRE